MYVAINLSPNRRKQFSLGKKATKANAERFAERIDQIIMHNRLGDPLTREIIEWLSLLDEEIIARLDALHLLRNWDRPKAAPSINAIWTAYVESRTDFADSTIKGFGTAWKHVEKAFGGRAIDSITVADALQFARDTAECCEASHARKIVQRLRQVFTYAINDRRLKENPFEDVGVKMSKDKSRQQYVPQDVAETVLDQFTHLEARCIFALARWCGLRVPHEPLSLEWNHVDWERERLIIPNETKTGFRVVPLFQTPLEELGQLRDAAADGATHIFTRARSSAATTWRGWLETAIAAAKVEQWQKLWVNLRASCRTDLEERFPSHVCDAWLGHSYRVAKDHYLQVLPSHWETAKLSGAAASPDPKQARTARLLAGSAAHSAECSSSRPVGGLRNANRQKNEKSP